MTTFVFQDANDRSELDRKNNEYKRINDEKQRKIDENNRITKESERIKNENQRKIDENSRIEAEKDRRKGYSNFITAMGDSNLEGTIEAEVIGARGQATNLKERFDGISSQLSEKQTQLQYTLTKTKKYNAINIYDISGVWNRVDFTNIVTKYKNYGFNSIAICFHSSYNRSTQQFTKLFTDADVGDLINIVKANNMKPIIKSYITGDISPNGDIKNYDLPRFFEEFTNICKTIGRIANSKEVEVFSIAGELIFLSTNPSITTYWNELFNQIRTVYNGKLTYGAFINEEFENLTFKEALDYIGLEFYPVFIFDESLIPSKLAMYKGSHSDLNSDNISDLINIYNKYKKPIIINECGVRNTEKCYLANDLTNQDSSLAHINQAACYDIMLNDLYSEDCIIGVCMWGEKLGQKELFSPDNSNTINVIREYINE